MHRLKLSFFIFICVFLSSCAVKQQTSLVSYNSEECTLFFEDINFVNKTVYQISAVTGHSFMAKKLLRQTLEESLGARLEKCIESYQSILQPNKNNATLLPMTGLYSGISIGLAKLESEWKAIAAKVADSAQKRAIVIKEISRCNDEALGLSNLLSEIKPGVVPLTNYSSYKAYQACIK